MPRSSKLCKKKSFCGNQFRPRPTTKVLVSTPPSASRRKISEIPEVLGNVSHNNIIGIMALVNALVKH